MKKLCANISSRPGTESSLDLTYTTIQLSNKDSQKKGII